MSHNVHFIKVLAEDCQQAIGDVETMLDLGGNADYFDVVGAFSLNNSADFAENQYSHFSLFDYLGIDNQELLIPTIIGLLNKDIRPFTEIKNEIATILEPLTEENIYGVPAYFLKQRIKQLIEWKPVTNLATDTRYAYDWVEVGLTYLDESSEPATHLVIVDIHS